MVQTRRFRPARRLASTSGPMSGHTGAEILGVDLSRPLDARLVAEIRATLLRWKVVFFRDQDLTQDQHVAFGARSSATSRPRTRRFPPRSPSTPRSCCSTTSSTRATTRRSRAAGTPTSRSCSNPPMASILRGVVVPPVRRRHAVHQPRRRVREAVGADPRPDRRSARGAPQRAAARPRRDAAPRWRRSSSRPTSVRCTRSCACTPRRASVPSS